MNCPDVKVDATQNNWDKRTEGRLLSAFHITAAQKKDEFSRHS